MCGKLRYNSRMEEKERERERKRKRNRRKRKKNRRERSRGWTVKIKRRESCRMRRKGK